MKLLKKAISMFLVLGMLTGLFPAGVQAAENSTDEETGSFSSVLVGGKALKNGDTLLLGYCMQGSEGGAKTYYPLAWSLMDCADQTLQPENAQYLLSRFLLPGTNQCGTAQSPVYELDTGSSAWSNISLPDRRVILETCPQESFYILNDAEWSYEWDGELESVTRRGVTPAEKTTEAAGQTAAFFSPSVEEVQSMLTNSTDTVSKDSASEADICRPFIYGFCYTPGTDRTWQLRSMTPQADSQTCYAVKPATEETESYEDREGGLIGELNTEETYWSRPACNLNTDMVSFYYAADYTLQAFEDSRTVTLTDDPAAFTIEADYTAADCQSRPDTWCAALRTLPQISMEQVQQNDQDTLQLTLSGDSGYPVGYLAVDDQGNVTCYGTARSAERGTFTVKLSELKQAASVYFFTYTHDTHTGVLETSNLLFYQKQNDKAVSLGCSSLMKAGDTVSLGNETSAYIVNPSGSNTALGGSGYLSLDDSSRLADTDAMCLVVSMPADSLAVAASSYSIELARKYVSLFRSDNFIVQGTGRPAGDYYLLKEYESKLSEVDNYDESMAMQQGVYLAYTAGTKVYQMNADKIMDQLAGKLGEEVRTPLSAAIAYTTKTDGTYQLKDQPRLNFWPRYALMDKVKVFYPSAAEYDAYPDTVKTGLGNIMLRSACKETYPLYDMFMKVHNLTVMSHISYAYDGKVTTALSLATESVIAPFHTAVSFHLNRGAVVFSSQTDLHIRSVIGANALSEIPDSSTQTQWNVALTDQSLASFQAEFTGYDSSGNACLKCTGAKASSSSVLSYICALVTDEDGNAKSFGTLAKCGSATCSVQLNVRGLTATDHIYLMNLWQAKGNNALSFCSPLRNVNEITLSGTLDILSGNTEKTGSVLVADTSSLRLNSGETLHYSWSYTPEDSTTATEIATVPACAVRGSGTYTLKVWPEADPTQVVTAETIVTGREAIVPDTQGSIDVQSIQGDTLISQDEEWLVLGTADQLGNQKEDSVSEEQRDQVKLTYNETYAWQDTSQYANSYEVSTLLGMVVLQKNGAAEVSGADYNGISGQLSAQYQTAHTRAVNCGMYDAVCYVEYTQQSGTAGRNITEQTQQTGYYLMPTVWDYLHLSPELSSLTDSTGAAQTWWLGNRKSETQAYYVDTDTEMQYTSLRTTETQSQTNAVRPLQVLNMQKIVALLNTDDTHNAWKLLTENPGVFDNLKNGAFQITGFRFQSGQGENDTFVFQADGMQLSSDSATYYLTVLEEKAGTVIHREDIPMTQEGISRYASGYSSGNSATFTMKNHGGDHIYVLHWRENDCCAARLWCLYGNTMQFENQAEDGSTDVDSTCYVTDSSGATVTDVPVQNTGDNTLTVHCTPEESYLPTVCALYVDGVCVAEAAAQEDEKKEAEKPEAEEDEGEEEEETVERTSYHFTFTEDQLKTSENTAGDITCYPNPFYGTSRDVTFRITYEKVETHTLTLSTTGDDAAVCCTAELSADEEAAGASISLTVNADSGYYVSDILVNNTALDAERITIDNGSTTLAGYSDGIYTFTMPDEDVEIQVVCEKLEYTDQLIADTVELLHSWQPGDGTDPTPTPTPTPTPEPEPAPSPETDCFVDVPEDAWYAEAVKWAVGQEITTGMTKTTFEPETACTRAQVVTFLWRAAGRPEPELETTPFTDVDTGSDSWYHTALLWAYEKGIVRGVTDTTFAPDAVVTRGQFVTMLYRFAETREVPASGTDNPFVDVEMTDWYYEPVLWAAAAGITEGTDATHFTPGLKCTRGQVVTFLYRYLGSQA